MRKINILLLALVLAIGMALPAAVMAASGSGVEPTLVDPWTSGDAAFECDQIGSTCDFSYKVEPWDEGDPSGDYYADDGNIIKITAYDGDGEYKTFDWESDYPVCFVIVKAGTKAYVYEYGGAYSDTGLYAPDGKAVSHATFCYSEPYGEIPCYAEETGWAAGTRYVTKGNWATYTSYEEEPQTTTLYAGKTMPAGMLYFSACDAGIVTITIQLNEGWHFAYGTFEGYFNGVLETREYTEESLHIQAYSAAPSGNPAPGKFAWKYYAEDNSWEGNVLCNDFYGIHAALVHEVECPVE